MRFRLVAKLVTLNNLERHNGRYFEHYSGSPSTTLTCSTPTYFKLVVLVYTKHNMAGFHSTSLSTVSLSLTTAADHCDQPAS